MNKIQSQSDRDMRDELDNWGRWSRDDSDGLGYAMPPTSVHYLPESNFSKKTHAPEPYDVIGAERTEAIIAGMRAVYPMQRIILIQRYVDRTPIDYIARLLHTNKPGAIRLMNVAHDVYRELRKC